MVASGDFVARFRLENWRKPRGGKASGSFFEKKEPKKLFSIWLRFGAGLGSLRP
jgi:hypothetical protein